MIPTYTEFKKLERFCLEQISKLNLSNCKISFHRKYVTCEECDSKVERKVVHGESYYDITLYMSCFNTVKDVMFAVAHELRHVWQYEHSHSPIAGHTAITYDETYDVNVYEMDANRYADHVCTLALYEENSYGMYFSDEELDIYRKKCVEAGVKIPA